MTVLERCVQWRSRQKFRTNKSFFARETANYLYLLVYQLTFKSTSSKALLVLWTKSFLFDIFQGLGHRQSRGRSQYTCIRLSSLERNWKIYKWNEKKMIYFCAFWFFSIILYILQYYVNIHLITNGIMVPKCRHPLTGNWSMPIEIFFFFIPLRCYQLESFVHERRTLE